MEKQIVCWTLILSFLGTTGCAVEVSLQNLNLTSIEETIDNLNRKEPDFIQGEVVTTTTGHQFKGVFGEIAEKKVLANGYEFDGAFYE